MTDPIRWTDSLRLEPRGHRIFREDRGPFAAPETCRWAIADNSGSRPDTTDDGILWLDLARPMEVSLGDFGVVGIPVLSERDGGEYRVSAGVEALATLRRRFPKWPVLLNAKAEMFLSALHAAHLAV